MKLIDKITFNLRRHSVEFAPCITCFGTRRRAPNVGGEYQIPSSVRSIHISQEARAQKRREEGVLATIPRTNAVVLIARWMRETCPFWELSSCFFKTVVVILMLTTDGHLDCRCQEVGKTVGFMNIAIAAAYIRLYKWLVRFVASNCMSQEYFDRYASTSLQVLQSWSRKLSAFSRRSLSTTVKPSTGVRSVKGV